MCCTIGQNLWSKLKEGWHNLSMQTQLKISKVLALRNTSELWDPKSMTHMLLYLWHKNPGHLHHGKNRNAACIRSGHNELLSNVRVLVHQLLRSPVKDDIDWFRMTAVDSATRVIKPAVPPGTSRICGRQQFQNLITEGLRILSAPLQV